LIAMLSSAGETTEVGGPHRAGEAATVKPCSTKVLSQRVWRSAGLRHQTCRPVPAGELRPAINVLKGAIAAAKPGLFHHLRASQQGK
jgi:hypothetical protein